MSLFNRIGISHKTPIRAYNPGVLLLLSLWCFNSTNLFALDWSLEKNNLPMAGRMGDEYRLRGTWPNSCAPELESITASQADPTSAAFTVVELTTINQGDNCLPEPTPFSILTRLPENTSISPEIYWLHRDAPTLTPRLVGFSLLALSTIPKDIRPASGWWWPEPGVVQDSGPGTGITIDYQHGLLTLITQSFNSNGQPEWLLGTAPLVAGISSTQLIKFVDGQTLTGNYSPPLIDNSNNAIHIRFLSASRATVWFESRQGETLDQSITLRKLSMVRYFMDPPVLERLLIGRWLLVAEDRPDYASHAQQFRIHSVKLSGNEASLYQTNGDKIGSCVIQQDKTDSPPSRCQIKINPTINTQSWVFDSFSLERMRGRNQDSGRVSAYKVSSR